MADFDPFANQGGAAAWDPEHAGDARKQSDELLRRLAANDDDPGSGPSTFSEDDEDIGSGGEADADFSEPDSWLSGDGDGGDYAEGDVVGDDGNQDDGAGHDATEY
jgi:hypothetical protein